MTDALDRWNAVLQLYGQVASRLNNILDSSHSLGLTDFLALRALATNWEPHMRIQQLASQLGLSHSATSRLVARLEQTGSLRRYECATDRRGTYTELTAAGKETFVAAEASYGVAVAEMMSSDAARDLVAKLTERKTPVSKAVAPKRRRGLPPRP